jgi:hypothetical protein
MLLYMPVSRSGFESLWAALDAGDDQHRDVLEVLGQRKRRCHVARRHGLPARARGR